MIPRLTVVALGVLLAVTGCSSAASDGTTGNALPGASAEQTAAMQDNVVSEDEYTAGYRRFVACLADKGYTVNELGRPSTVYDFGIPDAAVQSGADEECYRREFFQIDSTWQLANPPRTIVSDWLTACLEEAGIEVGDTSDSNDDELGTRAQEAGLDVGACIQDQSTR